jgi:hypothetical protein
MPVIPVRLPAPLKNGDTGIHYLFDVGNGFENRLKSRFSPKKQFFSADNYL